MRYWRQSAVPASSGISSGANGGLPAELIHAVSWPGAVPAPPFGPAFTPRLDEVGRAARELCIVECMVVQKGHWLPRDTAAATASFAARGTSPSTSMVSRSVIQDAASSSGTGACRAMGGASTPKSCSSSR
ncbi:hypothetical protein LUR56_03980 [Streptomyces sp. MT29]|nr:hypothetical protein [Streptomyces sp. MT29]